VTGTLPFEFAISTNQKPDLTNIFFDLTFTPSVKAAQQHDGSRAGFVRNFEGDEEPTNQRLGDAETDFIGGQRSFYMATVSESGWPYVQHRGGPRGFLKVLDPLTLAFADFAGNRQLISVGNLATNDRVALILVDYALRVRLKVLGHLSQRDLTADDPLITELITPGYRARSQRVMTIHVEAFDWNCPQHIPVRIDAEDVERILSERDKRIAELERLLAAATEPPTP
jgi:uncharacterized protein